jgi:hypothetical protein
MCAAPLGSLCYVSDPQPPASHYRHRPVHVVHVLDIVAMGQGFLLSALFHQYFMPVFHTITDAT